MKLPQKYDELTKKQRRAVRLEYIRQQNNKCWYCDGNLDEEPPENILKYKIDLKWFPKGFLENPIHLQHDHNTGWTEGAVHGYCNAVLWQYFNR
jgi:hypothetical protein